MLAAQRRIGAASLVAMPAYALPDGEAPPTEFQIFSPGVNATEKGDFDFSPAAAEACMGFWGGKGVELHFDYEHQSLSVPPIQAPAAGWWRPEVRDGALWATDIRWTEQATKYLTAKEYRYFSPAFNFDEESGEVLRIINCALTNNPAMNNIAPLVAASAITKESDMPCESCSALTAQLSAAKAECATAATELATLKSKMSAADDDSTAECNAIGLSVGAKRSDRMAALSGFAKLRSEIRTLTGQDSDAAALGAIGVWKADAAEVATLRTAAAEGEAALLTAELNAALDAGTAAGKVAPSEDHSDRKLLRSAVLGFGGGKLTKDGIAQLKGAISAMAVKAPAARSPAAPTGGLLTENQKRLAKLANMPIADREKFATKEIEAGS